MLVDLHGELEFEGGVAEFPLGFDFGPEEAENADGRVDPDFHLVFAFLALLADATDFGVDEFDFGVRLAVLFLFHRVEFGLVDLDFESELAAKDEENGLDERGFPRDDLLFNTLLAHEVGLESDGDCLLIGGDDPGDELALHGLGAHWGFENDIVVGKITDFGISEGVFELVDLGVDFAVFLGHQWSAQGNDQGQS